jgi:hypothetical protein
MRSEIMRERLHLSGTVALRLKLDIVIFSLEEDEDPLVLLYMSSFLEGESIR